MFFEFDIEFSPPDQTDDAYSDPALEVREVPGPRSFAFFILVIIASYTASRLGEVDAGRVARSSFWRSKCWWQVRSTCLKIN